MATTIIHTIRGESITIIEDGTPDAAYERIAEAIDSGGLVSGRLKGGGHVGVASTQVSFFEVHV